MGNMKRIFSFGFISILSCSSLSSAFAATLKPSGDIHSSSVYLSDIFSGLKHNEDRLLGPAPAPGKTIYIGGAQLIALADQYEVDWEDQSSTAQISLTRAGKVLDKDEYAVIIRNYVRDEEGGGTVTVAIESGNPITVSEDDVNPVKVTNFNWDKKTGRFSSDITTKKGNESIPIKGTIRVAKPVIIYTQSFPSEHIIQDEDVQVNENYTGEITPLMSSVPDTDKLMGMALTHPVSAGQPVQKGDLKSEILVHRNDPTLIVYTAPGIRLTATGRAVEDGGVGQFVHVVNLGNHMILVGRVSPSGQIIVDASSTAIAPDSPEAKRLGIQNLDIK